MEEQKQRERQHLTHSLYPAPTCRLFFKELLQSDFFVKENGASILITPTCARCDTAFGIGEVKEVERRGTITKITINDLTAAINVYTDKGIGLESKKCLAFLGSLRARRRRREGAGKGALVLVKEAEPVDEQVRSNWVLTTARRTMVRIELLRHRALEEETQPDEQWLKEAIEHYAIDDDTLAFWASVAVNAVKEVWQHYGKTAKEMVLAVLEESGGSMERVTLTRELKKRGLMEERVEEEIDALIAEGRCHEPAVGVVKVVAV